MAIIKEDLTNNNSLTITINSLTNNSARESTVVDNTTNEDFDAGVFVIIASPTSGTASTGYCNIYAYGSADGGSNYGDNVTGSNAAVTLVSPPNLPLIGVINVVANSTTYKAGPFSVRSAFGYLPGKWGIVVENKTSGTLNSSGSSALYERVRYETA